MRIVSSTFLFGHSTRFVIITLMMICASFFAQAQKRKSRTTEIPAYTPAAQRWQGYQQRTSIQQESLLKNITFRNVGPTVMSGRVVDLAVDPNDPTHFYVAYASGGLWETKNEGASFQPLFQNEIVMSIGDIDVDWENNTVYVGTGENNSSRSSYSGYGLFKSTDGGQSWQHLGLEETHHIGRVILHPSNPEIIWVAALGHLYSSNAERGIYKTTDGGKTWNKTLYLNDQTGVIELVINPENPDQLVAATWQKDRKAWDFVESGEGTGLYKSIDGGDTWTQISGGDSGFPDTPGTGRVGLTYVNSNTLFAVLDNQDRRPKEDKESDAVTKDLLRTITPADFQKLENKDINDFLDRRGFPRDYNAVDIKADMLKGTLKPTDLVAYLEDANTMLFDTEVIGGEVYRSDDGGATWTKTHEGSIEDFIYSYGYYFGQIEHDAGNPDNLYILGVPVLTSADAGKTWKSINGDNVHVDHHAIWINPRRSGHLILGNDGGIHISKDNGETWVKCNSIPVGQFYYVNYDMAEPYNIYGGLQDNGVWKGPSTYEYSNAWLGDGHYPYEELMGGDGMQVQIDPRDNSTVYTGFQFGNYFKIDTKTGKRSRITPSHKLGENPYRWNWQSPILLSSHNPDIVYFGSNRFHRSMNRADDFETLSGDLTLGGKKGDVAYGTLTTISESPLRFGLIYVGSDDGLVHVSKDAGQTWSKINNGLPSNFWVSRVFASNHVEGRVYLSLNGYRWDNFQALIYKSDDYGMTWQAIGTNLPSEPVNVIKEDPENPDLLYVGTDHGLYASLDQGRSFMAFGNLPAVAVHDVAIHPRDKELIVGTHGRSIYVADVSQLQALSAEILAKDGHLFSIDPINYSDRWGGSWSTWREPFIPSSTIAFVSKAAGKASVTISMGDLSITSFDVDLDKGLNYLEYDLSVPEDKVDEYMEAIDEKYKEDLKAGDNGTTYVRPGKYTVTIKTSLGAFDTILEVKAPRERPKRKE